MAKKQELEKIVRGKGLEALRPERNELSSDTTISSDLQSENETHFPTSILDKEQRSSSSEISTKAQQTGAIRLNKHCIISEIIPDDDEQELIQKIVNDDTHQIYILDSFITQSEKRGSIFSEESPLVFNVCCAASGLLEKLKPELEVHWITYDVFRMQPQPNYKFNVKMKPLWQHFKLQYQIQPGATGFFRFHVVVDIEVADLYWVKEGCIFKIV